MDKKKLYQKELLKSKIQENNNAISKSNLDISFSIFSVCSNQLFVSTKEMGSKK